MSDDEPPPPAADAVVTEEQAWAKWQEVGRFVDVLVARSDTENAWPHQPGSSLAGDDRASAPYQVSHAVALCLTAAIDHVHALKSLVVDHKELHTAAPASLSRGLIENAATAYWILHPTRRSERVARAMKWHVKNVHDREDAIRELDAGSGPRTPRTPAEQVQRMVDIGVAAGIDDEGYLRRGYRPSQPVAYSDQVPGLSGLGVLFAWKVCSGFAHGRPWASLAMLDQEPRDTDDPGVVYLRLTNDLSRALYPVMVGMHLMDATLALHRKRARSLWD